MIETILYLYKFNKRLTSGVYIEKAESGYLFRIVELIHFKWIYLRWNESVSQIQRIRLDFYVSFLCFTRWMRSWNSFGEWVVIIFCIIGKRKTMTSAKKNRRKSEQIVQYKWKYRKVKHPTTCHQPFIVIDTKIGVCYVK